jgi:SDR family mycofactocin-dependent oxidoreductase
MTATLAGRTALITGAARGQGRSHAVRLAAAGADVVVLDAPAPVASVSYPLGTAEELEETAELVRAEGREALTVTGDVRRSADMRAAVGATLERFGKLDVLVANAGIATYRQLVDMDDETWGDMIDVNLTGVANTIRAALPHMLDRSYGRIVVISSQSARRGVPNLSHYCAAKWGLAGLVKTVALETAPKHGITCNAVLPGAVKTPMMEHEEVLRTFLPDAEEPSLAGMEELLSQMSPMPTPWIDASDISDAVLFLASDAARHISGVALDVAAGFNAKAE